MSLDRGGRLQKPAGQTGGLEDGYLVLQPRQRRVAGPDALGLAGAQRAVGVLLLRALQLGRSGLSVTVVAAAAAAEVAGRGGQRAGVGRQLHRQCRSALDGRRSAGRVALKANVLIVI